MRYKRLVQGVTACEFTDTNINIIPEVLNSNVKYLEAVLNVIMEATLNTINQTNPEK